MKHIPQRKCVACGNVFDKTALTRIVFENEKLRLDREKKAYGRGAYLCENCRERKNIKKRALDRAFRTKILRDTYEELISEL